MKIYLSIIFLLISIDGAIAGVHLFPDSIAIDPRMMEGFDHESVDPDDYAEDTTVNEIIEKVEKPGTSKKNELPPWNNYSSESQGAMAIYITNSNCDWLALSHGLKTIGIPFFITTEIEKALSHKVVMIYPVTGIRYFETKSVFALREFVRLGGTLIGMQAEGAAFEELFGYEESVSKSNEEFLNLNKITYKLDKFTDEREKQILIQNLKFNPETLSYKFTGYKNPYNKPLASYNSGTACIIENTIQKGKTYAIGIDIGSFLAKGYSGKQTNLSRNYVNNYEPMLDVLLRLIREYYREAGGIVISTIPDGKSLAVIITHDIDYLKSVKNALEYAQYERSQNISATYFMQTKYIKDWGDEAFFNDESIGILKKISEFGMEIGSHSVSHSMDFKNFDDGEGDEIVSTYKPFIKERFQTVNGTVLGELVVSKHLLDSSLSMSVKSFRPGHLSYPKCLPQMLEQTNYLFSSSMTANDAITHFPFQLCFNRDKDKEVNVFEFPVTIEDEEGDMYARLTHYKELADKISLENGIVVLLIHPNVVDQKLKFEEEFVASQARNAWIGSLGIFGEWWRARNEVTVNFNGTSILVNAITPVSGITLLLPDGSKKVLPLLMDNYTVDMKVN